MIKIIKMRIMMRKKNNKVYVEKIKPKIEEKKEDKKKDVKIEEKKEEIDEPKSNGLDDLD